MNVLRQSCKKMKITNTTSPIASSRVISTSRMDSPITSVVSNAIAYFIPGGKFFDSRASSSLTRSVHVQRVGPGKLRYGDAHGIVAVESHHGRRNPRHPTRRGPCPRRRTSVPSVPVFKIMFSNSFGSVSRPIARTLIW